MVSITLTIDEKSKQDMQQLSWVNWSEVARNIFLNRIKKQAQLEKIRELLKDSEVSDEDVIEWSRKARKGRFKELQKKGLV